MYYQLVKKCFHHAHIPLSFHVIIFETNATDINDAIGPCFSLMQNFATHHQSNYFTFLQSFVEILLPTSSFPSNVLLPIPKSALYEVQILLTLLRPQLQHAEF